MIESNKHKGHLWLGAVISLGLSLLIVAFVAKYSALSPIFVVTCLSLALSTFERFKPLSVIWAITLLTAFYWSIGSFCSVFSVTIFSSSLFFKSTIGLLLFLSIFRIWLFLPIDKNLSKNLDLKSILIPISATFFFILPEKIRLASYLQSWDHVAGHVFTVRKIATTGFIPSFPADYFGFSPKAFHGLASGLGMGSTDAFEIVGVIQALEILIILGILQIFLSHTTDSGAPNETFKRLLVPFIILSSPFFMGWIYFMGFPPLLLAASALLLLGISDELKPQNHSIVYLIVATVAIQSWTLLFPVVILHGLYLGARRSLSVLKLSIVLISLLAINTPSLISIYLNNQTSQFSIGPRYSGIIYQLVLVVIFMSLFFLPRFYKQFPSLTVITYLISGLGISIFLIQFGSDLGIPYYSLKLFWLSILLISFMVVGFFNECSKTHHGKKVQKRAIYLLIFVGFLSNSSDITPTPYFLQIFTPKSELQYQAEVLLLRLDSQVDDPILYYSKSPYDSVAALFQHSNGIDTIEPQIMWRDTAEICKYVNSIPRLRIVGTGALELTKACQKT